MGGVKGLALLVFFHHRLARGLPIGAITVGNFHFRMRETREIGVRQRRVEIDVDHLSPKLQMMRDEGFDLSGTRFDRADNAPTVRLCFGARARRLRIVISALLSRADVICGHVGY